MDVMKEIMALNAAAATDTYQDRINKLQGLWNQISDPKTDTLNSYLIVAKIVAISLKENDLVLAWDWAQKGLAYSGNFNLVGESEFLAGEVAFAKSDMETAKHYFKIVKKMSGMRLFKSRDPRYLQLIK